MQKKSDVNENGSLSIIRARIADNWMLDGVNVIERTSMYLNYSVVHIWA